MEFLECIYSFQLRIIALIQLKQKIITIVIDFIQLPHQVYLSFLKVDLTTQNRIHILSKRPAFVIRIYFKTFSFTKYNTKLILLKFQVKLIFSKFVIIITLDFQKGNMFIHDLLNIFKSIRFINLRKIQNSKVFQNIFNYFTKIYLLVCKITIFPFKHHPKYPQNLQSFSYQKPPKITLFKSELNCLVLNKRFFMSLTMDTTIPIFVTKLFQMLKSNQYLDIVEWVSDNKGFQIKNVKQLQNKVLPKYFRHGNYSSFVRQLNMYDFHKVKTEEGSVFAHHQLIELNQDFLVNIKRKCYKKQIDKENLGESTLTVKFAQSLETSENSKPSDIDALIDQFVISVREQIQTSGVQAQKIIYKLRKIPKFKLIKGRKILSRVYKIFDIQKQKDDWLQQLSIQQVILYEDNILKMNSLAYLRSEAIFIKTQTDEEFQQY